MVLHLMASIGLCCIVAALAIVTEVAEHANQSMKYGVGTSLRSYVFWRGTVEVWLA